MLFKSGINLEESVIQFIEDNASITLFSAYLKLDELKRINSKGKIKQIIVRWEIQDLCLGSSDIELYQYCKDNEIKLFRNTRIHLKTFWNNELKVLFGSANVSNRGLGELGNYNYELNGPASPISFQDVKYLNHIITKSEYVSEELFFIIQKLVSETKIPTLKYPELETTKNDVDYFLISQLPMTISVEKLFDHYINHENLTPEEINFAAHDLTLFNVPEDLEREPFIQHIKKDFNAHPFIVALKEHIKSQDGQSLRYGGVVRWVQDNTTTVPTPRSWELKQEQLVNILYDWVCFLDGDFIWNTPNHSQVIFHQPK